MSDITKAAKVYVSTSKNGDYVSAVDDGDSVEYIRADLVPQWMPIDTAPEDGSGFLIDCDSAESGWTMAYFDEYGLLRSLFDGNPFSRWVSPPKYWMLPNPPPAT